MDKDTNFYLLSLSKKQYQTINYRFSFFYASYKNHVVAKKNLKSLDFTGSYYGLEY